ncbi:hypothetical protein [Terrarubrum flagellatum]|uniref:hypothetical protein n=1 Tax=Terrirubrum flagellatum TaxID=2895980 RepID=UPI0031454FF6
MKNRRLFLLAGATSLAALAMPVRAEFAGSPQDDLRRAAKLFRDDDDYEGATYWAYRGRYRMRALIAARPDTPSKDGEQFLWEFGHETGDMLSKIMLGDIRKLARILDRVMADAKSQDDAFTPKAQFAAAHAKALAEIKEIRDGYWKSRWIIRAERERDGMVNR